MGNDNYIDAKTDAANGTIEGSVCVVGAGAAGITLVRRLAETIPGIVLIESGGLDLDGDTQDLYSAQMLGLQYYDLTASRLRYFGGTTNHWSGFCRANDEIDYERRPSLGLPGWPLSYSDLEPYISEAAAGLGVNSNFLDPAAILSGADIDPSGLAERSSSILETKIFQIAQEKEIRLGPKYKDVFGASRNVRVYLNLNAVQIQLTSDGTSVDYLRCATLTGKKLTVRARLFVLCCHAIENARLLLTSNDVETRGIGSRFDHVGRYFMDHIHIAASKFVPTDAFPKIYNFAWGTAHSMNANIGFSDDALRQHDLLEYYGRFIPVYIEPEASSAIARAKRGFMEPGSVAFLRDVATAVMNLPEMPGVMAARRNLYFARPLYFELEHRIEQSPNPNSRVVISDRRDALGSLVADLDWRLAEPDYRSYRKAQELLGAELAALGWGRLMPEDVTPELVRSRVAGNYHNIGTTRMSSAPSDGVVDPDCRVHGVANLYVGGSSVFPSAGCSGPTMMIIGMALRMSEHLKRRLAA